ncbi:MAG: FtsW/RodA/SpoVE family cell cycle protein [Simkaniaceae bacterium]|nr:FtsW/RodA/SpoVE family cell cycle protein [Simkaniaceae bacterium]
MKTLFFDSRNLSRLDYKILPVIITLMVVSLLIISASTGSVEGGFFTPTVKKQLRAFAIGSGFFLFFSCFDYRKLREWTWVLYAITLLLLIGLFFTTPIQNVRRWYRLPLLPFAFQPSECAKIVVVIALSWFLERRANYASHFSTAISAGLIALIPFLLILKQPDLGTALVLYPITLGMFYFGGINRHVLRAMSVGSIAMLVFVFLMFSGVLSHEEMRPTVTKFIKDYQYERLNPSTYHQNAAKTAIALGSLTGSGFKKSEFTGQKWLPFGHTDSVFCVFTEEFGLIGALFVLSLYFALIYFSFQVTAVAKDLFGCLLSSGIAVYLSMHVLINVGMMTGFLPITGVPLILVSEGGSSIFATMIALGILQSIYSRRYMF